MSGPWLARGVASWRGLFKRGARCFKKEEDVQEIKLFRSSASYSIIAFGALFCFVMIIIVMMMIIIMIFIIIIVIITQPLVGSLFPVAIWLADSFGSLLPCMRSLWRV